MTPDEFRKCLRGLGLTQDHLALGLGMSRRTMTRIANGSTPVPPLVVWLLDVLRLHPRAREMLRARAGAPPQWWDGLPEDPHLPGVHRICYLVGRVEYVALWDPKTQHYTLSGRVKPTHLAAAPFVYLGPMGLTAGKREQKPPDESN